MYVFALNRIQRPNPKNESEPEVIPARTVFESSTEKFKELEVAGAARKATTEEIDVYKAQQARANGTSVSSDTTSSGSGGDDLDGKTVAELKTLADNEKIDLGDSTLKADIITKIRAARTADDDLVG